ncbi:phosphoenolpyruvate--protein phosphotransferase [Aminithiophilus ramosus]|uniref:Phosphoenolpyruvate-protein phosphotransferase n=2 Tax=Synergistales TaxID=649776 RepID=A0A9Q7AR44_9BACT|nr:phosphoenolpyruvate--protein phosphotransferase [Aminithiophilus ramosus]QTX32496.1 phosphoenolpyruvate--protein phosphotransferase [Aminithiophilus ramosus]QVL36373.1 phosphoenolpyruvate--protein phosphotransferase [Synergistota bacterium]
MSLTLEGVVLSPGIGIGPVLPLVPLAFVETGSLLSEEERGAELGRLEEALNRAEADLVRLQAQAEKTLGADKAALFSAHRLMLRDPMLVGAVREAVAGGRSASDAVVVKTAEIRALFEALPDPYLKERAADVDDVGRRLFRALTGHVDPSDLAGREGGPFVVVARDLTPSDTALLDPSRVVALVTEEGGPTSHTAIIAQSLAIPALSAVAGALGRLIEGTVVIVDGLKGEVVVAPDEAALDAGRRAAALFAEERRQAEALRDLPAVSADGVALPLWGNIARPDGAGEILSRGGDGVGLFRTEFLYMGRDEAPTEEEQLAAYAEALTVLSPRPVTIRTLDAGGDKEIPYLASLVGHEANPFLGYRAIRLCLDHPELFKVQLRALLRAAVAGNLWLMFPMVVDAEELRAAKALLDVCAAELEAEGLEWARPAKVGVMIETPGALLMADLLAREVDFFSVGTNDLTQYLLAADRMNPRLKRLQDPFHPAVIRGLSVVARAAAAAGIDLGMCGEMAGDPLAIPLLAALGFRELSMTPARIPAAKKVLRSLSVAEAGKRLDEVLKAVTTAEVRSLLASWP